MVHTSDAHLLPHNIATVRDKHPFILWGPLDKNNGHAVGACIAWRAQLFEIHLAEGPRYQLLYEFHTTVEACTFIVSNIVELA